MPPRKVKKEDSKKVIEVIPMGCGFAGPSPFHPEGINEGTALVTVWDDGSYDVLCSYYNETCRQDCQILKTIRNGQQNEEIEPYEFDEDNIIVKFEEDEELTDELNDKLDEDEDEDEDDELNDEDEDEL